MTNRVTVSGRGKLSDLVTDDVAKMIFDLHGNLTLKSPVDTGRFRAGYVADVAAKEISNNVEYGEELVNGHSPQAPQGWFENEIDAVVKLTP